VTCYHLVKLVTKLLCVISDFGARWLVLAQRVSTGRPALCQRATKVCPIGTSRAAQLDDFGRLVTIVKISVVIEFWTAWTTGNASTEVSDRPETTPKAGRVAST
jgi:hypothetical protein